ncbi:MAG: glycoside hydrolase family 2 TIM barrel-domain containing protein [Bryobacteraceae bacterium]
MPSRIPSFAFPAFFAGPGAAAPPGRPRTSLHGPWERYVNDTLYDVIPVPSSQRPLGFYRLKREVPLPRLAAGQRAFLCFDSVHYHGRAFANGAELGTMGPYVPYEFEITRSAREGNNSIEVAIADLIPEPGGAGKDEIGLGLGPGWEASGGIVRDTYVEFRPSAFVENVRLGYTLSGDFGKASCRAGLMLNSAEAQSGRAEIALLHNGTTVAHGAKDLQLTVGVNEVELPFDVDSPVLWAPQTPNLYTLRVVLHTGSGEDTWTCRTGFRSVRIDGPKFLLNGEPLVLHGVCRHDMWKDQGFTLTREQMQQDMRMIKMMGANFVRLAHYPHHRYVIELAEELGLFVTEEPGHWNVDIGKLPRGRIDASLRVMEGAIRRDWNSPALFAWLLGNECTVTVDYLREGKALCKRLDPIARPVSFAHIYNDSKKTFDGGGMDFYAYHQYDFSEDKFEKIPIQFGPDKPLVHTEWGWEVPGRDEVIYERSFDRLMDALEAGKVAGYSFWSWQDMRQYNRVDWATQNGILMSGVVDEAREPREWLYLELARLFQMRRHEATPVPARPELAPLRLQAWSGKTAFQPVDLKTAASSDTARQAWQDLESRMAKFWKASGYAEDQWARTGGKLRFWREGRVDIGGAPFESPLAGGEVQPIALTPDFPSIRIPVGVNCVRLHVLGHVTLPAGYPVTAKAGETAATYIVHYTGGGSQQVPLRNGIEIARSNLIHAATRVNPIATAAPRALVFTKDVVRERYQVLMYSLPVRGKVESLEIKLSPGAEPLLLFAITAELPAAGGRA